MPDSERSNHSSNKSSSRSRHSENEDNHSSHSSRSSSSVHSSHSSKSKSDSSQLQSNNDTNQSDFYQILQEINRDLDSIALTIDNLILSSQNVSVVEEPHYEKQEAPINPIDIDDTVSNTSKPIKKEEIKKSITEKPNKINPIIENSSIQYNKFYRNRDDIYKNVEDLYQKPKSHYSQSNA